MFTKTTQFRLTLHLKKSLITKLIELTQAITRVYKIQFLQGYSEPVTKRLIAINNKTIAYYGRSIFAKEECGSGVFVAEIIGTRNRR